MSTMGIRRKVLLLILADVLALLLFVGLAGPKPTALARWFGLALFLSTGLLIHQFQKSEKPAEPPSVSAARRVFRLSVYLAIGFSVSSLYVLLILLTSGWDWGAIAGLAASIGMAFACYLSARRIRKSLSDQRG
jgi:O-antigen/teichoic acid export membrane protein